MGFACLPLARPQDRQDFVGLALFGLLLAWAAVSGSWSPAANVHLSEGLSHYGHFTTAHLLVQLVMSGAFVLAAKRMTQATARKATGALALGVLALAAIVVLDSLAKASIYQSLQPLIGKYVRTDFAIRNVAIGGYIITVLFWPISAALYERGAGRAILGLLVAIGGSFFLLRGDAPILALAPSALVFVLVLKFGRPAVVALMAAASGYILTAPWLFRALLDKTDRLHLSQLPASWMQRLAIWRFVSDRIQEKPLLGWGLDASRTFPGRIPLHPHNEPLQVWFELGAVGAVLAALAVTFVLWRYAVAASTQRLSAAVGSATLTACLIIGSISFSLWQEWWVCLGALAFAACIAFDRSLGAAPVAAADRAGWTSLVSGQSLDRPSARP
jgi:O-antigen ligase